MKSRKQNNLPGSADRAHRPHGPDGFARRELEDDMQAFGMLLLAAATAGDGFGYTDPGVGGKKWLRPHLVSTTACHERSALQRRLAGRRRWHGRRQRAAVHRHQEPDLLPRPQRHADRLADRHRAQRRTDLPARPTDRAGSLQLQPGLHLSPEDHQYPRAARRLAVSRRSRSPRRPRRPTPTWPTTRSPCSSPPKTSTRWSTAATS